jgi:CubicO group peptidase (beta-lactamase class C family)
MVKASVRERLMHQLEILASFALLWMLTLGARAETPALRIDTLLMQAQHDGHFNGVALVSLNDKVLLEKAYGHSDPAHTDPLSIQHRFNIGSIGKEISAVALMQLAEHGKLSLDDPLSKYLPDFPSWAADIRLLQLLNYNSGLPEMRWRAVKNDTDARNDLLALTSLQFPPGTDYGYTYNNIMVRQFVVERITGKRFADFARRAITDRCAMHDSLFDPPPGTPHIARAFSDAGKFDEGEMPVSGIVFVTAHDLLRFSQCVHRERLLEGASLQRLATSDEEKEGPLGHVQWQGGKLGRHVHHGESRNNEALLRVDPASGVTIVLLSNNKHGKLHEIADGMEAALR